MAERFGARRGRDILFGSQNYARDAFDPSEARDPGGKWTGGGGGGGGGSGGGGSEAPKAGASGGASSGAAGGKSGFTAHGPAAAAKWRDEVVGKSSIKTIDDLLTSSEKNQAALAEVGDKIARELGIKFKNPGPKKRGPLEIKLAKPGKTPQNITDAARGGFNVTKPDQADAIAQAFAKAFPTGDEGWAVTNVGYFDRKLMVQFPNNQMGEIQIWEPSLLDAKENQGGHEHYEKWRTTPIEDLAGRRREEAAMRAIYQPVLDKLPPEWKAVTNAPPP